LGTLVLPLSGTVYIDANAIIYRVEGVMPYLAAAKPLWDGLRLGTQQVVTSELSLLEVLVKPVQQHSTQLQQLFRVVLYKTCGFSTLPITRHILEAAAQLRATTGLKAVGCS
jgi:predicted nucleic acid-binding protein